MRKQGRSKMRNALVSMMDTIVMFQHGAKHLTLSMLDVFVTFQNGANLTLHMLDTIVTFQDGPDLEPTDNLSSPFLTLGTCTGHPQTHRRPNHSIKKCLLHQPKNKNNIVVMPVPFTKIQKKIQLHLNSPINFLQLFLGQQVHFAHHIYVRNLQLNHGRQCR